MYPLGQGQAMSILTDCDFLKEVSICCNEKFIIYIYVAYHIYLSYIMIYLSHILTCVNLVMVYNLFDVCLYFVCNYYIEHS